MSEETKIVTASDNDEIPSAPKVEEESSGFSMGERIDPADFQDDEFDSVAMIGIQEFGEVLPKGTYYCRADSYTIFSNEPFKGEEAFGEQPTFVIRWVVQEEPDTGKSFSDFVPWVNKETMKAAIGSPMEPKTRLARSILQQRLSRMKTIMDKAGYRAVGATRVTEFLDSNPELKISVGVKKKKDGGMVNRASKYISLLRSA